MLAALIHREDRIDEAASTATVATALSGLGFGLLALAASPLIGLIFHSHEVAEIAAATSGLLFVRALLIVPQALLQRRFSFLRRMIAEPVSVIVFGVVAVIATSNGMGAWGLVVGYYASAVADVILSWSLVRWRPRIKQVSYAMWRELVAYGRYVLAAHAVMLAGQQLPVLLVGRFSGESSLGQLRYAERLAVTPVSLVIQAGSYVLFPAFSRITDDRGRFRAAMLRSLRLMCALSFPLVLILIPLGVPMAVILFGQVWKEAGYATMTLAPEAAAGTLISFASEVLKADGHPEVLTRVHICLFTLSAIAMLALLPLGLLGVTSGISLGCIGTSFYAMSKVRKLNAISIRELLREILPPLGAALAMAAIMVPLEFLVVEAASKGTLEGLGLLLAEGLGGLLLYVGFMHVVARHTMREMLGLFTKMIRRGQPAT